MGDLLGPRASCSIWWDIFRYPSMKCPVGFLGSMFNQGKFLTKPYRKLGRSQEMHPPTQWLPNQLQLGSHLCFPFETLFHYWQYLLHTTSKNYPYSLTAGFGFVICVGYWPELGLLLMYRVFHHSDAGSKSCNLISSNKLLLASKQSISFSFLFLPPLPLLVLLMAFPLSHLPRKKTCPSSCPRLQLLCSESYPNPHSLAFLGTRKLIPSKSSSFLYLPFSEWLLPIVTQTCLSLS